MIFAVKTKKARHHELVFNGIPVARENFTKHLGVYLDGRLSFAKHIREAIIKAKKGIALLSEWIRMSPPPRMVCKIC